MAKININFNNKNYPIDESAIASATAQLQAHLSTKMNGSGSVINLGGIAYNIDSTKLSNATNDFVTHLGTIAGTGTKVVVNGVEYNVSSTKMENAVSDLHVVLEGLKTGMDDSGNSEPEFQPISWNTMDVVGNTSFIVMDMPFVKVSDVAPTTDELALLELSSVYQGQSTPIYATSTQVLRDATLVTYSDASFAIASFPEAGDFPEYGITVNEAGLYALNVGLMGSNMDFILNAVSYSIFVITSENRHKVGYLGTENENLVIPATFVDTETGSLYKVIGIDYDAFKDCANLTSVVIPDGMTSIGFSAFRNCSNLTNVTIPNSVTEIKDHAFENCSSLTSVIIPNGVTTIHGLFFGCSNLEYVFIPESVTNIDNQTFYGCSSLTSITIPEGVTNLGSQAFYGCSSLTSITIPEGVPSMEYDVFCNCTSLTSITFNGTVEQWNAMEKGVQWNSGVPATEVICSNGTVSLVDAPAETSLAPGLYETGSNYTVLLKDWDTLVSENIIKDDGTPVIANDDLIAGDMVLHPEKITNDALTYYTLDNLTGVVIPSTLGIINSKSFYNCPALTSVVIESGITEIKKDAFYYLPALQYAEIPDTVTKMGEYAFNMCNKDACNEYGNGLYLGNTGNPYMALIKPASKKATSYDIHPDCRVIVGSALYGCSSAETINLPSGLVSIGSQAFNSCSSITSITIPSSVQTIPYNAFAYCSKLANINFTGTVEQWNSMTFGVDWNKNIPATEVVCTDGTVAL